MAIRGIIFDMDGTITAPYLEFTKIRDQANIRDRDLLDYLREVTGAEYARIHAILMKFEEDGVANAKLNRGARTLLNYLARHKIPTALLTRNSRKSVAGVCRKLKLKFDVTVTREDGPHKPSPAPIRQVAKRWKLKRSELLVVGDYKWDVLCARNAGVRCAVLVNGSTPDWAKDADVIITRLTDVIRLVEGEAPSEPRREQRGSGRDGARPSKGSRRGPGAWWVW